MLIIDVLVESKQSKSTGTFYTVMKAAISCICLCRFKEIKSTDTIYIELLIVIRQLYMFSMSSCRFKEMKSTDTIYIDVLVFKTVIHVFVESKKLNPQILYTSNDRLLQRVPSVM